MISRLCNDKLTIFDVAVVAETVDMAVKFKRVLVVGFRVIDFVGVVTVVWLVVIVAVGFDDVFIVVATVVVDDDDDDDFVCISTLYSISAVRQSMWACTAIVSMPGAERSPVVLNW